MVFTIMIQKQKSGSEIISNLKLDLRSLNIIYVFIINFPDLFIMLKIFISTIYKFEENFASSN